MNFVLLFWILCVVLKRARNGMGFNFSHIVLENLLCIAKQWEMRKFSVRFSSRVLRPPTSPPPPQWKQQKRNCACEFLLRKSSFSGTVIILLHILSRSLWDAMTVALLQCWLSEKATVDGAAAPCPLIVWLGKSKIYELCDEHEFCGRQVKKDAKSFRHRHIHAMRVASEKWKSQPPIELLIFSQRFDFMKLYLCACVWRTPEILGYTRPRE